MEISKPRLRRMGNGWEALSTGYDASGVVTHVSVADTPQRAYQQLIDFGHTPAKYPCQIKAPVSPKGTYCCGTRLAPCVRCGADAWSCYSETDYTESFLCGGCGKHITLELPE